MAVIEKSFKRGEIIVKEGEPGKSFFQLIEGKVGVYADYDKKEPFRLAILEPGEYFGEMAILEEYPRSSTVVAEGNVTILEIPGGDLNAFFREDTDRIYQLMLHLGTRVDTMTKDYIDAQRLLKEARESDAAKKKSLFSKLKKHIDMYQANKNGISELADEGLTEAFASIPKEVDKTKTYSKGMIVFKEGEVGHSMYILREGSIGMYNDYRKREEVKTEELNAVAIFGEIGMITGEPRPASAIADEGNTVVETIHEDDLEDIFKRNPTKVNLILKHLSYTLRRLNIDFLRVCKEITETYGNT